MQALPLFPERASTISSSVDHLYFYLVGVGVFFSALIFILIFYFAIRYRRRSPSDRAQPITGSLPLELAWMLIPFGLEMVMFFWAAQLYFVHARPPKDASVIYIVAKQWMWKLQHPEGRREINELHVPIGRPFRLVMASEDVIHSFFVPAFRIKQDVLPGRYTSEWFQATKTGKYHLFCAEYCGTNHSRMIGWVYVMSPVDYQNWLNAGSSIEPMAAEGENLFQQYGCSNCHKAEDTGRGPSLVGLFGHPVLLQSGRTVIADEAYVRESILNPDARIVAGYPQIMPTFQGQINEDNVLQLLAYIKSLRKGKEARAEQ